MTKNFSESSRRMTGFADIEPHGPRKRAGRRCLAEESWLKKACRRKNVLKQRLAEGRAPDAKTDGSQE
jgi:hypothetical protein